MNFALRIYRRLAEAFPHEFKLIYGTEVLQLGEDVVKDIAREHGVLGLIRLIADIAIRVPLEYLSEMRGDLVYGFRGLIQSPGFALVGILSMGIGIGLTTNVYSSKWEKLFRDLPAAANAKDLVMAQDPISNYYIDRYRDEKTLFAGVAAFQNGVPFNVTLEADGNAKPQRVFGQLVSPEYFSVLGVPAQRGRTFSAALDRPGDAPVVVISDRFWRNRLNSSEGAVGRILRVNGRSATIVGITPENFNGAVAANPAELFVPTTAPAALAPELQNDILHQRNAKAFLALMCLARGVTIESAEAGLDTITRRLDAEDLSLKADKGKHVTLLPAGTRLPIPREMKPVIAGFLGVLMGLIITLACTNLATMLIARGANRRKELAIRLAVGASRFRLIRQMMSEGILLALLGGIAGFAIAFGLAVMYSRFSPPQPVGMESDFNLDWHAGVFAFGLALVCGVGFSLAPALQGTRADLIPALKEGSTLQLPGYRRFGLRNLLMVAQVAASLMLLLMTGFLVIGLSKTSLVQPKFDPNLMALISIDPVRDGYTPEKTQALFERLPARLKSTGQVRDIALAEQAPFGTWDEDEEGAQLTAEDSRASTRVLQSVFKEIVGAGYFAALSERVLTGREFDEHDQRSGESKTLPVVLNETAQHGLFGAENAIGKLVREGTQSYEVVGVVGDLKNGAAVSQSVMYLPLTPKDFAQPPAGGMSILVRPDAGGDFRSTLTSVQKQISAIDPNLTILKVQTLNDYLERKRSSVRFGVERYGGIGVFGLVLAAIGLAGVTAYAVAQRRKEIAIRTALGATRGQVLRLVLREGAALVCVGSILGFLGAVAMAKVLSSLTSIVVQALNMGMDDSRLLAGAPLLLAAVTMIACYVPARRSTRIDPVKGLREE